MGKSGFQRDEVSTEGTSSPVLGQDLEHEFFPHPRALFPWSYLLMCTPLCARGACGVCLSAPAAVCTPWFLQDVLVSKARTPGCAWAHLLPFRRQQRGAMLPLRLCSGSNFIDQVWLENNSVELNTVKNSLFFSEFSVQRGRHRLINEMFFTTFRSTQRDRFKPLQSCMFACYNVLLFLTGLDKWLPSEQRWTENSKPSWR